MKIAIIGMGNVGGVLGRRWSELGHHVTFGARKPSDSKATSTAKETKAKIASVADAVASAEVVVLATPWKAVKDALSVAGDLSGKVLLDCTCPLTPDLTGLEIGTNTSGGEIVAQHAKGAKVVKIFCTTGAGNMADPVYGKTKLTMPYAGDDLASKQVAAQLAAALGFDPIDVGPLTAARALEPLGLLWVTLAYQGKLGTDFAMNIVRRSAK
jgi:8-hydroxy-5-deazaflavin:NADPH oxidoreductase